MEAFVVNSCKGCIFLSIHLGDMMGVISVGESASMLVASLLIFFMLYTKPRRTYTYSVLIRGAVLSFVVSGILLILGSDIPYAMGWPYPLHAGIGVLYLLFELILICHIYAYMTALSSTKQTFHPLTFLVFVILAVIMYGAGAYLTLVGNFDTTDPLGLAKFCAGFGIGVTLWIMILSIARFRKMSRVVRVTMCIFFPVELFILISQLLSSEWIFVGLSTVIPLTIFYLLFHSNPYDDSTGTQNAESMFNHLDRILRKKQNFVALFVDFPQLHKEFYLNGEERIRMTRINLCRRVESISYKINIYMITDNTYAVISPVKTDEEGRQILDHILEGLEEVENMGRYQVYYKAVAIRRFGGYRNLIQLYEFWAFLREKLGPKMKSECYLATTTIYEKFLRHHRIRETLEDIRDRQNMMDPRVMCYAQPIYNVRTESFRTAESLMRLMVDGDVVSPNDFIPEAERMGCIHDLTKIMLTKVCTEVAVLEKEFDFDGITINCSATEFMDKNLHQDLLGIIDEMGVDHNHIRFEITESSMVDHYDSVLFNMEKMNEAGILFYLDDFGTGYSNLERIITCPFDTIKFDKTMLYKGMQDKSMDSIMTTMVDVLKERNKVMLVEGVETEEQCAYSIERGFDFIQGFKYAKPQPIEKLNAYFPKKVR